MSSAGQRKYNYIIHVNGKFDILYEMPFILCVAEY